MTTRQVVEALQQARRDLDYVTAGPPNATVLMEAMRRIWASHPSQLGAQSLDGIRSPGYDWSPPKGAEEPWDHAATWAELHADAAEVRKRMDRIYRNVKAWEAHAATPKDRQLAGLNAALPPGCEHCQTVGLWSEPHVKSSDVKGNLPAPLRLCQPCYEHTLRHGQLPSRKQLEDRKAKGSWKESA